MSAYLLARLQEPSTWRGLCAIAMGFGAVISPQHFEMIITAGVFISGAIGAFFDG
jgi:hypothetical protein